MSDSNQLGFAGDVSFKSAKLISYNGIEIEIIDLIDRVDIYEDIYAPFITMDLQVTDSVGLIDKTPFIGEESIVMNIQDATGIGLIEKIFFVYKIKDRLPVSDKAITYTMCCISIEALVDLNTRISMAFTGFPHDIARKIVNEIGLQTDKKFNVEETSNRIQYISNYWSIVENLKFLSSRAISKGSRSPSYIFYENLDGFNFVSQDALVSQESAHIFAYSNRENTDINVSFSRINKLYIDQEYDYIDRLKNGMYGNRLLLVNPFAKSYNYRYMDFLYMYDKMSRLNNAPIATEQSTRRINSTLVSKNVPSSAYTNMKSEGTSNWFQQRQIELATREAQTMQIDVVGRFNVDVGHVADVFIYSEPPKNTDSGERDLYSLLDKLHSGRYMISAIHRVINRAEGHQMSVQLIKDSRIKEE